MICALFVDKSLCWQGFQPMPAEIRRHSGFQLHAVFPASYIYQLLFPLILVRRGLARLHAFAATGKKILLHAKSGYICCC
jgi:hypothetical protein